MAQVLADQAGTELTPRAIAAALGGKSSGAIGNALNRASATLRDIRWFEVTQIRGHVVDNAVGHYQVSLKLGFTLEDAR